MAQTLSWPQKFSDEVLDYEVDWTSELEEGETIVGDVEADPTGGIEVESNATTDGITRVRLSGGTSLRAAIDFLATTSAGEKIGVRVRIPVAVRP